MTSFSTLLRCVYRFHFAPALCLLFSTQRFVYFFYAAPLRLLSCADPGIFVRGGGGGGGGGGDGGEGPGQSAKKSFDNVFFSLVLILFYRSQMVNFKENHHFSRIRRGSNFFQVGRSNFFQGGGPIAYSL